MGRNRGRIALALASLAVTLLGCPDPPLAPSAGVPEYQTPLLVSVFGGVVNAAGGNLHIRRVDLSIDTRLGAYEMATTYNSATRSWLWSFQMTYSSGTFVDATGASHSIGSLASNQAIPGTTWVKLGASQIKTKGGLVHDFATDGRLINIHRLDTSYPRLNFVAAAIAGQNRIVTIEQCDAANDCVDFFTIAYNGTNGRINSIEDRANRTASYTYDTNGRILTAKDALDTAKSYLGTRYEYAATAAGHLLAQTGSDGDRIEYGYSGEQIVRAQAMGVENPQFRFAYRGVGDDSFYETDYFTPSNAKLVYAYDGQRRLASQRNAQTGDTTTYQWSGVRPTRMVRPGGVTTTWTYVGDDVASTTLPSGNVVQVTYQANAMNLQDPLASPTASITDSLGTVETRTYASGRVATIANGAGEVTIFTYGGSGQITRIETPLGTRTNFSDYGRHGHPRFMTRGTLELDRVYDTVGNLTDGPGGDGQSAPSIGGIVSRKFDEARNVISLKLADLDENGQVSATKTLTIERRADGQISAIRRPYGGDWEYVYDAIGRMIQRREKVDGVWRTATYAYDAFGRESSVQAPNGMRTEWTYDSSDRVATTRILEDGIPYATLTRTYQNDRLSTLTDTLRPGGSEAYTYDAAGRISHIDYPWGEEKNLFYDARSRSTLQQYFDDAGAIVTYIVRSYDLANRVTDVYDRGVRVLEHEYQDGVRSLTRYGNGLERSYDHDVTLGMISGATTLDELGAHVEDTTVDWEPDLFQTHASTHTRGGLNVLKTETYYYGPFLGPQTPGVRVAGWSPNGGTGIDRYQYDELNNLRSITGDSGNRTFHYNPEKNRLTSITGGGGLAYTYDEAGYATSREGMPIDWDAGGRIKSLGSGASFTWDVSGRPVNRNLAGEVRIYLFGGEMKATPAEDPVSLDLGEVELRFASAERFYRHFDFRGNVKFVTDDAAAVQVHYRYEAYARQFAAGSTDVEGEFAQGLATAGLLILGTRAYDPDAARFLAPDPVPQLVNQYAYTMGNPVLFWDPTGRIWTFAQIAEGAQKAGDAYAAMAAAAAAGRSPMAVPFAVAAGASYTTARVLTGLHKVAEWTADNVVAPSAVGRFGTGEGSLDKGTGEKGDAQNSAPPPSPSSGADVKGKIDPYSPLPDVTGDAEWYARVGPDWWKTVGGKAGATGAIGLDFGGGFGGMPGGGGPCGINIELALVVPLLQALWRRRRGRA